MEKLSEEGTHTTDDIVNFLLGSGSFDGYWFSDIPKDKRSPFWWRKNLRNYQEKCLKKNEEIARLKKQHNDLGIKFDKELERWQERDMNEFNKRKELESKLSNQIEEISEYICKVKELEDAINSAIQYIKNPSHAVKNK